MDSSKLLPIANGFDQNIRVNNPKKKRLFIHFSVLLFITCTAYMTIFTQTGSKLLDRVLGRGRFECHGVAYRNASRHASTLPTTRVLPSGDKIPTVALGASFPDVRHFCDPVLKKIITKESGRLAAKKLLVQSR
jgi:hypothetical protein